jgi:predicted kinase
MARGARFLLQMAGAPGSGKSSLARAVATATSAVVLDSDAVKSEMLDAGVEWSVAGGAAYGVLFALAAEILDQGRSVIIDSPSHYPTIPERGLAICRDCAVSYRLIECVCEDVAELERRLGSRSPRRSQMRGVGVEPLDAGGAMSPDARSIGPHRWRTFGPDGGHLLLDTRGALESYLPAALSYATSADGSPPDVPAEHRFHGDLSGGS